MHLAAEVAGLQVFRHVFRHQVAAIAGGVDQHIVRWAGQRAVERRLEAGVTRFVLGKAEIVDEDDEAVIGIRQQVEQIGEMGQAGLVHLDQAQPLGRVLGMHGLHQRGFAAAARAGQQHVVGGLAGDELARVGVDPLLLLVDRQQILQRHPLRVQNRFEFARLRGPARGADGFPVEAVGSGRTVEAVEQPLDAGKEGGEIGHPQILAAGLGKFRFPLAKTYQRAFCNPPKLPSVRMHAQPANQEGANMNTPMKIAGRCSPVSFPLQPGPRG